ncbi:MAG: helix-turn-helix domain-containing protein [Microcoleus sp.]
MESKLPIEELLYEEEGTTLDFKIKSYEFSSANDHQKSEILKDILAFANAWRRVDAYILLGVEEVKGGRSKIIGIQEELDDAHLQQFINGKTQRPIEFNYRTVLIDGEKIGVVRIPVQTRPFYLEKDYGKLKKHVVYIRRGSSTDEASPEEVRDMGRAELQVSQEIPSLSFEFANLADRSSIGTRLNLTSELLDIPPIKEIPDYREETNTGPFGLNLHIMNNTRPDYYKDMVKYYYVLSKSTELAFLLKNDSTKAISDIRVEFVARKIDDKFVFFKSNKFPEFPKSHNDMFANYAGAGIAEQIAKNNRRSIEIQDLGDNYRIEIPFEKAQPKQTVFSKETVYIAANESFTVEVEITIFADNIPIPIKQKLEITCDVSKREGSLEYIKELHQNNLVKKYVKSKAISKSPSAET